MAATLASFEQGGSVPYFRCPGCGLLAHVATEDSAAINCPRCRALQHQVQLLPVEESLRLGEDSSDGALAPLRDEHHTRS
jgi:phage FluMu protein Com